MKILLLSATILCSLSASASKPIQTSSNKPTKPSCTVTVTLLPQTDYVNCPNGSTNVFIYNGTGTATANTCAEASRIAETKANAEINRRKAADAARAGCPTGVESELTL